MSSSPNTQAKLASQFAAAGATVTQDGVTLTVAHKGNRAEVTFNHDVDQFAHAQALTTPGGQLRSMAAVWRHLKLKSPTTQAKQGPESTPEVPEWWDALPVRAVVVTANGQRIARRTSGKPDMALRPWITEGARCLTDAEVLALGPLSLSQHGN